MKASYVAYDSITLSVLAFVGVGLLVFTVLCVLYSGFKLWWASRYAATRYRDFVDKLVEQHDTGRQGEVHEESEQR
jgi:hypothetical protein